MLFLHGYMSCKESFYYQIKEFSQKGYRCVAPDMPFFGASEGFSVAWGVEEYAKWLKRFMQKNDLCGANILAHSFGARVAICALSAENDLCSKLIITGGAGIVKPRSSAYMRQVKRYRRVKRLFPRYAEKHFGSEEYKRLSPLMRESYKKIVNRDLRAEAARIKNETLLLYGRDDCVTPPSEEGKTFANLMPNSRLVVLSGDHFCFVEHSQIFNGLALEFLNSDS